jgi:hypothetical protein
LGVPRLACWPCSFFPPGRSRWAAAAGTIPREPTDRPRGTRAPGRPGWAGPTQARPARAPPGKLALSGWQAKTGQDAHSQASPKPAAEADLRFEYNDTTINKIVPLDGAYLDVKGAVYNGQIVLAPFTSAVLIHN